MIGKAGFAAGLAGLAMLAAGTAAAHPHVFIGTSFALRFSDGGLAGIDVAWRFDDIYTDAMLPDYLKKGETQLSAEAVKKMEQEVFHSLTPYRFYTEVMIDGKAIEAVKPKDFTARIEDKALVFAFTLPFAKPVQAGIVEMLGFDPEYFIEYTLTSPKPEMRGTRKVDAACMQKLFRREAETTGAIVVGGLTCKIG